MKSEINENFARTKILCTLGPATESVEIIGQLLDAGIDGVRLNFSHGSHESFEQLLNNIRQVCTEKGIPLAVLADLQGPKMRVGELSEPEIELKTGNKIEITTESIIGTEKCISTSYSRLIDDASIGDPVLIDDGLIRLRITGKKGNSIICIIENGGILRSKKGMNLPGMKLSTPSLTEKDYADLDFVMRHRVDYIALSFVRSQHDISVLKEWLKARNSEIPVIAKIEKPEAVENFDEILDAADGIMVARGDLGVEMEASLVPVIQKEIIKKCNSVGKLVITATQMLDSMIHNPVPTRAEASDVANAVWDGTDVVMLSGETSIGKFPVNTVNVMNDIIRKAEDHSFSRTIEFKIPDKVEENLFDSVGKAVVSISRQTNASVIAVFTFKGRTAVNLSKFRPDAKIIGISNNFTTINRLCLRWGVIPLYMDEIDKEHNAIDKAKKLIVAEGYVRAGDVVIFTAGSPYSDKSRANWLRIEII
ncbi:MAG TPA: pyruvate kinase [Ignavibacteriaceae bacterium]